MQLILQPCSDQDAREHYVDTIEKPVLTSRILPHLPEAERETVSRTFPHAVAVWGVTPGKGGRNARKWERMAVGDAALLYRNMGFFFRGTVAHKVHSRALALDLWNSKPDGTTWEYVFFLTDLEAVEIPVERFNAAAGYKASNVVQGFDVLPPILSERILDALELDPGIGVELPLNVDVTAAKAALAAMAGDLDHEAMARRRREQQLLRTILLGTKDRECCAMCGRSLPVDLLVIGHIRKRHSCSVEQKKDLANVMVICLLGCDQLFENGYIYVDGQGIVRIRHSTDTAPELLSATEKLAGRTCLAWNPLSDAFFNWHRQHPRRFV